MLSLKELDAAISELERKGASLSSCAKLADLYTVRDHLLDGPQMQAQYSNWSRQEVLDAYGDSDFLMSIAGKPAAGVWCVMDELMETLMVVNPRVYDSVMRHIERL